MAKQRRVTAARTSRSSRTKPKKAAKPAARPRRARQAPAAAPAPAVAPARARSALETVSALPVARKPAYYEAIAAYETGVRALQRHDFAGAAEHFRTVIQRHPDERELVERATLYLRVCDRETANRARAPQTPGERIYAATVALNSGDANAALAHLRQALSDEPQSDHGNYIMAVALSEQGKLDEALEHLRKAIALNPENRALARQDPDLAVLRETPRARALLDSAGEFRRGPRGRR